MKAADDPTLREEFPALLPLPDRRRPVYLDSAATTLTPTAVIEAVASCYRAGHGNPRRGAHAFSERGTATYEGARERVRRFLGATSSREIVLSSGCTEAINLVAQAWGGARVHAGDEVLVSELEHHSNWLPWQQLCQRVGARFRVIPVDATGVVDLDAYRAMLGSRTRLVALAHVSNVVGSEVPVETMTSLAHAVGARVLIDGAQAVARCPVRVSELGCDFYAMSGHKLYGPYGIGALYVHSEAASEMGLWKVGGGMVELVDEGRSTFVPPPHCFESGTPNVAGAAGLTAALDFVEGIGLDELARHEQALMSYAAAALGATRGVRILGAPPRRVGALSFVVEGVHPHDLSTILDRDWGVAIRAGHHCAQPLHRRLGIPASCRVSFGVYNTMGDVDVLLHGLRQAQSLFGEGHEATP